MLMKLVYYYLRTYYAPRCSSVVPRLYLYINNRGEQLSYNISKLHFDSEGTRISTYLLRSIWLKCQSYSNIRKIYSILYLFAKLIAGSDRLRDIDIPSYAILYSALYSYKYQGLNIQTMS